MTTRWLALDIGGAQLKAADCAGYAAARFFPLWREPEGLAAELSAMIAAAPPATHLAVTMTGELADCYTTKAEGVARIIAAVNSAADERVVRIYLTDGELVSPAEALERPLAAAAANWHALATFAARFLADGQGVLIDIGSTTCDIIPLVDGRPSTRGLTDPERLTHGELVYTGVVRSPVCAVVSSLPWRGQSCPTAQEVFATTRDAYLLLGQLAEDPDDTRTADGRGATRTAAHDRLARSICADRTLFDEHDALAAATAIANTQRAKIGVALRGVLRGLPRAPRRIVISGQGEFLARDVMASAKLSVEIVSLGEQLGDALSHCAPAHALAVLARERDS